MDKKGTFKKVLASVTALLLLSGCAMFPEEEEALAPPLIEPTEVNYETEEAVLGTISEEVNETCTVVSNTQYSLSFGQQSGSLASKDVSVGDTVKKGDVLARLDCGDAEDQLANAKINLQIQNIQLERALSRGEPDVDSKGNPTNFDAQIIKLQIEQQKLQIRKLEDLIANATIYAPVSGVVTYMTDAAIGSPVTNRSAVCQVADLSRLEFEYAGSKASKLKLGTEVTVTYEKKEYKGKVSATYDSVPKEQKSEFDGKVRISLNQMPDGITIGESARFYAVTAVKEDAVIVPKNAVTGYLGSYSVRIYQDGIVSEQTVEIGLTNATQIEILKGVNAGELVVVD